ncbi:MAG: hypothetical protein MJ113_06150 [Lachnospiraceae bacterium]|nr:hypothetical protein [Lachnospiraceae bacterium]
MIKAFGLRTEKEIRDIDIKAREKEIESRNEASFQAFRKEQFLNLTEEEYLEGKIDNESEAEDFPDSETKNNQVVDVDDSFLITNSEIEQMREDIRREILEMYQSEAEAKVLHAQIEAQSLLSDARSEANSLKQQSIQEGLNKGMLDAKQWLAEEREKLELEFKQREVRLEQEYSEMKKSLEPGVQELLISLLEKISGISYEENTDVLRYLIETGLEAVEKTKRYIVRIASEDLEKAKEAIEIVKSKQENDEVLFEVVEDKFLQHGDCQIETDSRVVECGLGNRLNGLIQALRMLS